MKELDLSTLCVEEMNETELREIGGGWLVGIGWLLLGVAVSELLDRNAAQDFMDGWNAAKM